MSIDLPCDTESVWTAEDQKRYELRMRNGGAKSYPVNYMVGEVKLEMTVPNLQLKPRGLSLWNDDTCPSDSPMP